MTLLAASVSLVVAAFLSYNAMSIAIAQRRPVISTMRALGGRRRTIVSDMLVEAALLGFIGGAVGSLCGVVIGHVAIGEMPSTMVQSLEARLEYVLPLWVVPLAVAACVVASVTASALAARQVHTVAPIEALAPNGAASSPGGSRRVRIFAGIVGVVLVGVTIVIVTADLGRIAMASIALAFIGGSALYFAFSGRIIRAAAGVARLFGAAGVLGAATIESAPQRMWVAMMTVLTAVVTTVAVTGATSNAVGSTVASFSSIADADVWVSSAAATDYSSALLPPDTESNPDGSVPDDNPFLGQKDAQPEIWSYGHRSPEGAAINPQSGKLWESEFDSQGGDEINIVQAGKNYGWPVVSWGSHYDGRPIPEPPTHPEFADAIYHWNPVISPSGITFYTGDLISAWRGDLLIAGLSSEAIVRLTLDGEKVKAEERVPMGTRIRDVVQGPDGAVYALTDETDGKILKLTPEK